MVEDGDTEELVRRLQVILGEDLMIELGLFHCDVVYMPFNIINIKELFLIKWKYRTNFIFTITCSTIKIHNPIIK